MPVKSTPAIVAIANELPGLAYGPPTAMESCGSLRKRRIPSTPEKASSSNPIDSIQYACQCTFGGGLCISAVMGKYMEAQAVPSEAVHQWRPRERLRWWLSVAET